MKFRVGLVAREFEVNVTLVWNVCESEIPEA